MSTFGYPTNSELQEIAQVKLPRLMEGRLGFDIIPAVDVNAAVLEWEQEDNWTGLQGVRGLGGAPRRVKNVGGKKYQATPGVYGEFITIDEVELTLRRQYGTFNQPIQINDLVMRAQDRLLQRRLDRQEYIIWKLLTTGTYSVSSEDGTIVHTDTYDLQSYNAGIGWSNPATATPLADGRALQLKARGKSVSFGPEALWVMNRVTVNRLLSNTNSNDLAGKRTDGLANIMSIPEVNVLLAKEGLPQIAIYDEGYLDDSGAFVPYIADGETVVVGRRVGGQKIADYAMTRNANNPDMAPGAYMKVVDNGEREVPREIAVHDGHNGGIRFHYPSAVVRATVG